MSETSDVARVMEALAALDGVRRVTRGWPDQPAGDTLPCAVVQLTGERALGFCDDEEYLVWREYTVRVFARDAATADALELDARRAMRELGYARSFSWEENDGSVHQRLSRYQTCL